MRKAFGKALFLAATSSLCATAALAQPADQGAEPDAPDSTQAPGAESAASEDDDNGVTNILVTAQRREQALQDVPISVTAASGEMLESSGIVSSEQLSQLAPGLTLTQQRQTVQPYLRGVGTQNTSPGDEGTVALYIDNVYRVDGTVSLAALNNVERIEILKGPQGTLFGRNAVGGLIHILTRDPQRDFEFNVEARYESYETISGSLYANMPLAENVALNFSGYLSDQGEGWGRNLLDGTDLNMRDEISLRPKLRVWIGENTTATAALDFSRVQTDYGNTKNGFPGRMSAFGGGAVGSIYDTSISIADRLRDNYLQSTVGSLRVVHSFPWAELSSTTAYSRTRSPVWTDADGTGAINAVIAFSPYESNAFQQELILSGDVGIVDFTTGLYYLRSEARFDPLQILSEVIPAANTATFSEIDTESYSAFLQGDVHVTDRATLTLGARYTHDNRGVFGEQLASEGNPLPVGTVLNTTANLPASQTDRTWDKITYRAAFAYEFTPDILAYASFNTGYKSGVFSGASPFNPAVNPETLEAYEIGVKTDWFGRTLRLNASLFHYDYSNVQLNQIIPFGSQILNAGRVDTDGAELEMVWAPRIPTGSLSFNVGLTYLDSIYASFPNAPALIPRPTGGNQQVAIDASGNRTVKTPEFSASLAANYAIDLANDGELAFNVTYSHTGSFFWDPDNIIERPALNLVNARVSWRQGDRGLRASLFVRNLTDEQYYASVLSSATTTATTPGAPRIFGVSVGYAY